MPHDTATEPAIVERAAQPYLGTRHEVAGDIRKVVDAAFPALFGYLSEQGVRPAGPPFIRLLEADSAGEPLLIDVGAPVDAWIDADGDLRAELLPAGRPSGAARSRVPSTRSGAAPSTQPISPPGRRSWRTSS